MIKTFYPICASGSSDVGLVRKQNEDVWASYPESGCFALADGMGGHKAGEVAAEMAVSLYIEELLAIGDLNREEAIDYCARALAIVNRAVFEASERNEEWKGMGTTLSALLFVEKAVVVSHVGDSRAYRVRDGEIKQLTTDHTGINKVKGTVLTRAIGTQSVVKPQIQSFPVHAQDRYLLTSDGLTNYVGDREILGLVQEPNTLENLVALAKKRGGADNITAVLVEVGDDLSR